ncbi:MAG: hypothetical protein U0T32_06890 [Chitinophagales bacterium]
MRISLFVVFFSMAIFTKSQSSIRFCASVNADGGCMLQNNKFFSSPDSLLQKVSLLASNVNGFNTDSLHFVMNSIDKNGQEKFYSRLDQSVQSDWIYVWQAVYFNSPGRYSVRVLNRQDVLQAIGTFELFLP